MADPFFITGPALISFSGGRTSAYMLWRILQAHGGTLPSDVHVCFANTGKEREETLRFVHECATRWGVPVNWLEFVSDLMRQPVAERFAEVGYNSASRAGEPFDRLIERKQAIPSSIRGRWCTVHLKLQVLSDFMRTQGLLPGKYVEVVGLRADEGPRVYKNRANAAKFGRRVSHPLNDAGIRKADITAFWQAQDFDLHIIAGLGNCDHCPFVGDKNRIARARIDPAGMEWWARHEIARKFRMGRTYTFVEVLGEAARSPLLMPDDDGDVECGTWCAET